MKKIINGKKYDTKTARKLFQTYKGVGVSGELYLKKTGEFFEVHWTNWDGQVDTIEPLAEKDAREKVGEYDGDLYEELFGEVEE